MFCQTPEKKICRWKLLLHFTYVWFCWIRVTLKGQINPVDRQTDKQIFGSAFSSVLADNLKNLTDKFIYSVLTDSLNNLADKFIQTRVKRILVGL